MQPRFSKCIATRLERGFVCQAPFPLGLVAELLCRFCFDNSKLSFCLRMPTFRALLAPTVVPAQVLARLVLVVVISRLLDSRRVLRFRQDFINQAPAQPLRYDAPLDRLVTLIPISHPTLSLAVFDFRFRRHISSVHCMPCGLVGRFHWHSKLHAVRFGVVQLFWLHVARGLPGCPKFGQITVLGASSVSQCTCPPGTIEDATQCNCPVGMFYSAGVGCTNCSSTSYKDFVANGPCLACPSGASVPAAAIPAVSISGCSVCSLPGQVITLSGCVCGPSYAFDAALGGCFPCSGASYKALAQNTACTSCPSHSSSAVQPATNVSACICPNNSTLATDKSVCNCALGYEWNGVSCSACSAKFYKDALGDGPTFSVVALPPAIALSQCQCPINSRLLSGVCQCDAGYAGVVTAFGLSCVVCDGSSFKGSVGNGGCSSCPGFATVAAPPATSSVQCACPTNSSVLSGSCQCDAGFSAYFAPALACVPCSSSSFNGSAGNTPCTACPNLAVVAQPPAISISSCVCPALTSLSADQSSCVCSAGYFRSNGFCQFCSASSYKSAIGDSEAFCVTCPPSTGV